MDVDVLPKVPDVGVDALPKVPDVDVDVSPKVPDADVDVLPEVPDVDVDAPDEVVNPPHGLMVLGARTPGAGVLIIGLTPAFAISVEPRGIVPPLSVKVEVVPGADSGEAVPVEDTFADVQPGVEIADPVGVDPPPSKVELMTVEVELTPVDDPVMLELLALQFELIAGLKPPGSISVTPSGMPVLPVTLDPGTPSGDVALIAGVLVGLCAWPAPQLNKTAAVITNNRRIDTSCTILPLLLCHCRGCSVRLDALGSGRQIEVLKATVRTIGSTNAAP